jgi:type II secretory pathway pseudopilin PulG
MSNTNKQLTTQRASTLVEILIAVSIIAVVLTAVSAMIIMSIKLSSSNEQKQLALQKAEEAMEFFRKERAVNSWYSFSTPLVDEERYCISNLPVEVASISAQLGACEEDDVLEAAKYFFKREAAVTFNSANNVTIEVNLSWADNSKAKNVSIKQNFENY